MKKLKYLIRNFFGFSQRETNGFIVLFLLLVFILFIPSLVTVFYPVSDTAFEDQKALDSIVAKLNSDPIKVERSDELLSEKMDVKPIDPNEADIKELENVFGKKVASIIIKFRTKGGRFKTKLDLKKIYGINDKLYQSALPFINIPDPIAPNIRSIIVNQKKEIVDINSADTIDFEKLKGIGPVLARRILKYRSKLGGFVTMSQLAEVYGLKEEVLSLITDQLIVKEDFVPQQIPINKAFFNDLRNHPYIAKHAGAIINYRNAKKQILTLEELADAAILTKDESKKLIPYISF